MGLPIPFDARLVILTADRIPGGTFTVAAYGRGASAGPWFLSRSWATEGAYGSIETLIELPSGILDGCVVSVAGIAPVLGSVWCAIKLRLRGPGAAVDAAVLGAGYLTGLNTIGYPAGGRPNSGLVVPAATVVSVGDPAAGADWTYTVPVGSRVRVYGVAARLVTSAVVANRVPNLLMDDGAVLVGSALNGTATTASLTRDYVFAPNAGATITVGAFIQRNLSDNWLLGGFRLRMVTTAIDVADQWSDIRLTLGFAPAFAP